MKIVNLEKVNREAVRMEGASGVQKQVPISRKDGAPNFSFRVFTFEPGGHTPFHTHPNEHVNYIIEGDGAVITEQGQERPFKQGDFILIPPNEKHQYRNRSANRPMVMICAVPIEYE